jgi:hypothetical protein
VKKKVAASVLTASMLFTLTPQVNAASFAALYVGEGNDVAVTTFRSMMSARYWTEEVFKTGALGAPSANYPYHYHFTNGSDNAGYQAANDSDLVFIAGHGQRNATIEVWWNGVKQPNEYVGVDTLLKNVTLTGTDGSTLTQYAPPWEVGAGWISSTANESRWNKAPEWVILGACSQLDKLNEYYSSSESSYPGYTPAVLNFSTDNGAAKAWARTMLGSPHRVHQILGYFKGAPGGDIMSDKIEKFIEQTTVNGVMTLDAWELANESILGNSNWAALTHWDNRYDYLHNATADTSPNSVYYIDYYRQDVADSNDNYAGRTLDGRGGSYETVASIEKGFFQKFFGYFKQGYYDFIMYAKDTISGKPVYASIDKKYLSPSNHEYKANAKLPETTDMERIISKSISNEDKFVSKQFKGIQPNIETDIDGGNVKVYRDGGRTLKVFDSGAIVYESGRPLNERKASLSKDEAIEAAKQFVQENDILPTDAEVAKVYVTSKTRLNLNSNQDDPTENIQYKILFRKGYNGKKVEGNNGEFISVTLDENGVRRYQRDVNEIQGSKVNISKDKLISAEQAINNFVKEADKLISLPDETSEITNVELSYYSTSYKSNKRVIKPAWRVSVADQTFFVDAINGIVLTD